MKVIMSIKWKPIPKISKIYEAITAVADDRIEIIDQTHAKCYSSSRNKFYEIELNLEKNEIMSNDNMAYWSRCISYPMIAYLMKIGRIDVPAYLYTDLKGYNWKDIDTKFKDNYDKAVNFVLEDLKEKGCNVEQIKSDIEIIFQNSKKLELFMLGVLKRPPEGY
jgi:hypothetical protein